MGDGGGADWGAVVLRSWSVSEAGALAALDSFLASGLRSYEAARAFADGRGVSRLSPYIRSGQLSVRLVWQRLRVAQ